MHAFLFVYFDLSAIIMLLLFPSTFLKFFASVCCKFSCIIFEIPILYTLLWQYITLLFPFIVAFEEKLCWLLL